MKEVDELAIVHLRHDMIHDVSHSVVYPVESHAWRDAARAIIEPAQHQSYDESVQTLCPVKVYCAEDKGRDEDGPPMLSAAKHTEQWRVWRL